jgi:hypothetical protein
MPVDKTYVNFYGTSYKPDYDQIISLQEEIGIPPEDLGKSHQLTKSYVSDPSEIVREVNVPEITSLYAEFVYNYYLRDERINYPSNVSELPLSKTPRYVLLTWKTPDFSEFNVNSSGLTRTTSTNTIETNSDKIVSEDNFFNPGYISHTFSNIDMIEQGSTDLENYSRISQKDAESLFKMSKYQIQEVSALSTQDNEFYRQRISELTDAYSKLADFPKSTLGLRVYDKEGNVDDQDDLIRSISNSLSLSMKINGCVVPDVFKNSKDKGDNLENLRVAYANSLRIVRGEDLQIRVVQNDCSKTSSLNLTHPVSLIGYVVDRYILKNEGLKKDATFYIENIETGKFIDRTVLYGNTYVYSVRVVADVKIMTYDPSGTITDVSTVYVSSRPISIPSECYEYVPPPEPNDIKFTFDHTRRLMTIHWDFPVNPQKDIKQVQVFRRKTIREPFELIAQYGFDRSSEGPGIERYKTGERVDANNLRNMRPEDKYLVIQDQKNPEYEKIVYMHTDEDFIVDPEFFTSSEFIYAVCSVDAHGMISNYSSQHHVAFDPYKNRLITKVVCDSGSPRQYPNMKLRVDAFKDTISVSGDASRRLKVYFTPEYLTVRGNNGVKYKIVEAQNRNQNSYYILQMINLDNQKTQLLKINIKDPQNLTA